MIARLSIATALFALVAFGAWYVVAAPSSDEPAPGQPHQIVTDSDGDEVQIGTALETREGRSMIPDGDVLTCLDWRDNSRWAHCRMVDRQSGDRVSCTDQAQNDAYGCIKNGVQTRTYDWHQNGYKLRGSDHVYWGSKKSCHDCSRSGSIETDAVEGLDGSSATAASSEGS
jgi:hypothetical protein